MKETYLTVRRESSDECVIQKSRFIGYAAPCETEEAALAFLKTIREKHRDARHHCYAYIIGSNQGIMRYSDDGEPGGTAGLPIMSVLRGKSVVNCCVVVVRYFGGVLLGTGGLVRAYTEGCRLALSAAEIVRMEWTQKTLCEVPYPVWDSIQYVMKHLPARMKDVQFTSAVAFLLLTREADTESVLQSLLQAANRQMETLPIEESYEEWED